MTNSRLLHLLRTFTPSEWTTFGKYLRSPLFNQREDVRLLSGFFFKKLSAERYATTGARPKTDKRNFQKEVVFRQVFPASDFDAKRFSHIISDLLKAAEGFLVWQSRERDGGADFQLRLSEAMRHRHLDRHFETAMKKAGTALEKQPHRNLGYHQLAERFHRERYEATASQHRSAAKNFQEMADESTLVFVVERLRQGCTAHMHRAVSEADYRLDLMAETLALVEARRLFEMPAVGLYYFGYRALSEEDSEPWFEKLREAMRRHSGQFPKTEMRDIYTLAVNWCIPQINIRRSGNSSGHFLQKVFEIYQEGLDNQVFTEGGVLSHFTYKNIANAGLGLKAFDWVENFLHQYRPQLEARHRDTAFLFNLASLHFRKSDYGKVLELLTQSDFDDVLHQLDARRMLLRSYFELGEFDALDSLLDSFQTFLRRRRDVGYLRQNYLNLIRFTQKLLKTPVSERAKREKLRQDILQSKALAEREWLLRNA